MKVELFTEILHADFYTGVPDSQLKALCNYLMHTYGIDTRHHIIAANEGSCTAIAAGYYLATGKIPVVYMQNSGEGNIINPVASLLNERIYAIPIIFVIGWRGEPGIDDEPQHIYQGQVTVKLLEDMDITPFILSTETSMEEVAQAMEDFRSRLTAGKSVAFLIRKGSLTYRGSAKYQNSYTMAREDIIRHIVKAAGEDPIVSTTGKASRELFEIRASNGASHKYDFLTVGSMGHSSSIAFGIASHKPRTKIWCIDGDGAMLMHMGAMAVIGVHAPRNLVHIVINNGAHETVGGMPTVAGKIDVPGVARACGYSRAYSVDCFDDLDQVLLEAKQADGLCLVEVKCSIGARDNLGRPTTNARENKENFMAYLKTLG